MNTLCFLALLAGVRLETTDPTNPTERALERWKAARMQILKKQGNASYEIRKVKFYGNDVATMYDGPATSAVVTERTISARACIEGMRVLTLSWKKGDDQAIVDKERLIGEDCCDFDHCSARTAGGWMAHVVRVCAESEGRGPRLEQLVDPKRGIRVEITTSDEAPGHRRTRWKRADADSLCNLSIATFTCEDQTTDADRFTCSTKQAGEDYDFVWRRVHEAVYIETISGHIEN